MSYRKATEIIKRIGQLYDCEFTTWVRLKMALKIIRCYKYRVIKDSIRHNLYFADIVLLIEKSLSRNIRRDAEYEELKKILEQ